VGDVRHLFSTKTSHLCNVDACEAPCNLDVDDLCFPFSMFLTIFSIGKN